MTKKLKAYIDKEWTRRVKALKAKAYFFSNGPSKSIYRVGVDTGTFKSSLKLENTGGYNYNLGWHSSNSKFILQKMGKTDRSIINGSKNLYQFWSSQFK